MEKLRFTQLFHESEKVSEDEKKKDIILKAFPDDEKAEIEENYEAADFDGKLEEFFDKYKDILDNAKSEESNDDTTSETDSSNEIESSDEKPTEDENLDSDNTNSDVETDEESEEQLEMEEESASSQDSTIKNGKSPLNLSNKYYNKLVETLKITPDMEKDFEKYEEYFGYTSTGKKDSVKVMFHTPEYWPIKTGDYIKSDNPLFHTVACMNEFLIWRMGVQIYNSEDNNIKGIFNTVLKSGKAGSALNAYVKKHADETKENIAIAIEEIRTGSTVIDDPFETGKDIKQKNNIILFMFTKIFPTLLNVAKTGKVGGLPPTATSKILGEDSLYGKLYLIGRGEYKVVTSDDVITDLIIDSYSAFLGGRLAVRAPYENEIKGSARFGTAVAKPLCIFDNNDGWLENKSGKAKNIYQKMDKAFSEKNEKFEINIARKKRGKGAIKAIGLTETAYELAIEGATDKTLQFLLDQDEITQKDYNDIIKARQYITIETTELEPFAYIANTVGADFNNFLSCLTRVGAAKVGILDVYDKQYYSEEDIKNEKDPKKKEEMLEINKRWEEASIKIRNFDTMSMDAPTTGKDGDTGTTVGDLIASKEPVLTTDDKITLSGNVDVIKFRLQKLKESILNAPVNTDADRFAKIKATFALLCLTKYIYMALTHWEFTPIDALNAVIGKTKVSSSGRYDTAGKKNHPLTWEQSDWIRDVYSDKSELNNAYAPFPIAGLYDTKIGKALAELRSPIGLAYTAFTPEGIKQIDGDIKEFTQKVYTDCKICLRDLGFDVDRIKTDDDMFNIKFDNKLITKPSQIVRSTLFKPGISEFNDDISVYGANWFGPTGSKSPDYKPQRQDWFEMSVGKMLTQSSLETIVNNDEYKDTIEEVKKLTGVDLYDLMQQILEQKKKEKNKGFDLKKAIAKQNPDAKIAQNINSNRIFVNNKETPAKKFGDKLMQVPTKGTYVIGDNTDTNYVDMNDSILSNFYNQFFGEVFREASEKEKTKKQRFTIN